MSPCSSFWILFFSPLFCVFLKLLPESLRDIYIYICIKFHNFLVEPWAHVTSEKQKQNQKQKPIFVFVKKKKCNKEKKTKTQQKKPNGAKQQAKTKEKRKEKRETHRRPSHAAATRERNPSQTRRCLNCRHRIPKRETATPAPPLSPCETRPWLRFTVKWWRLNERIFE